jgi:NADPH:quinone reductase-like Zn-dependent oxidoreductase
MKAIVRDAYGSAGQLDIADIAEPEPAADEVLVRVRAAGVGPDVWHVMTGLPYLVRLMGYGLRRPKERGLGQDVAGVVEAVGKDVLDLQPGDAVFGTCRGAFAEYACADAEKVVRMPTNLSFEQAAAVPVSGCAALLGLRDEGHLRPGRSVLVIGAAGGIGTLAVQLGKAFEAHVTGVCSTAKVDLVESLGADRVIDYTRQSITDGSYRYDLILDTAGRRSLSTLRRALGPRGTLVIVGGEGGNRWTGGFGRQLRAAALSPFVRQRLRMLMSAEHRKDLLVLKDLIEAGRLTPVVDRTYPLSQAIDALEHYEDGHPRGKIVITV